VLGIDLSPGMIAVARERAPNLRLAVGSMLALPAADGAWAGVIALYSIIHLSVEERATACREFARTVRPGGWLLVSFQVGSDDFAAGSVNHITSWFSQPVQLDGYFLDPPEVAAQLESAKFTVKARMDRQPSGEVEYPSRRCYLLAQRHSPTSRSARRTFRAVHEGAHRRGPPPAASRRGERCLRATAHRQRSQQARRADHPRLTRRLTNGS